MAKSNSKTNVQFKASVEQFPESTVIMMVITALLVGLFSASMFFIFVIQQLGI